MKLLASLLALNLLACGSAGAPRSAEGTVGETPAEEAALAGAASAGAASADADRGMCELPEEDCAIPPDVEPVESAKNVLGTTLETCSEAPLTGFRRTGRCETGPEDRGVHVVCAEMTDEFLEYTRLQGNDLSTPRPEYGFAGLQASDRWCLCAARWAEAASEGVAPPVILEATEDTALRTIELTSLERAAN